MARALPRTERIPRLSRLSWLMGLYARTTAIWCACSNRLD